MVERDEAHADDAAQHDAHLSLSKPCPFCGLILWGDVGNLVECEGGHTGNNVTAQLCSVCHNLALAVWSLPEIDNRERDEDHADEAAQHDARNCLHGEAFHGLCARATSQHPLHKRVLRMRSAL